MRPISQVEIGNDVVDRNFIGLSNYMQWKWPEYSKRNVRLDILYLEETFSNIYYRMFENKRIQNDTNKKYRNTKLK